MNYEKKVEVYIDGYSLYHAIDELDKSHLNPNGFKKGSFLTQVIVLYYG